jgi:hypothetical protein
VNFFPFFLCFLADLGAIWHRRSPGDSVGQFEFPENWRGERSVFVVGMNGLLPVFSTIFIHFLVEYGTVDAQINN